MTTQWYCSIAGQQFGPLPFEQLQQWAAEGRLQPSHHVCLVGQQQWIVAQNVPGLFGAALPHPQTEQYLQPGATSEPGFNFPTGPSTSTASRPPSKPKNDGQAFKWGSGILAGVLTAAACTGQLMKLSEKRQQAAKQRQQEVRRQQKINTPPPLPPISSPKVDMDDINRKIKQARTPPRQEPIKIPKFSN